MYIAVGTGGIFGALLRFLISGWFAAFGGIPLLGTFCVNITGCFMLGFLQGLARVHKLPNWFVLGMGTGFIGAFTTFSTFSTEVITHMAHGNQLLPLAYIAASSSGGYFLSSFGFSLGNRKDESL